MAASATVTSETSSAQLTGAVRALATELRRAGASVSPDEIALTTEALSLVDLRDASAIADVIQACLVKHRTGLLGSGVAEIVERWVAEDDARWLDPEAADEPAVADLNEARLLQNGYCPTRKS